MCGNLEGKNVIEIMKYFNESLEKLCENSFFETTGVREIYIHTHKLFALGIIQILYKRNCGCANHIIYQKKDFDEDVKKGSVMISNLKIEISGPKLHKNRMLASAYGLWPKVEQLLEFEKRYQMEKFYDLVIPIKLFG